MRTLHLLNHVDDVGDSIVNQVVDLAVQQVIRGHDVHVISAGGAFEHQFPAWGIEHHRVPTGRDPLAVSRHVRGVAGLVGPPDTILHAHMTTGLVVAVATARTKCPIVATSHTTFKRSTPLLRVADAVIAVSHADGRRLVSMGLNPSRVHVVANGTIGGRRRPSRVVRSRPPGAHIISVSGLFERKGIGDLIRAVAMTARDVPGIHLTVLGEGPDRPTFERLVVELGVGETVSMPGFVSDPMPQLEQADVFVLAS
jgi:glycosyltransferase involved in cell wall biosynthesis